jgi:hypothetical protein
MCTRAVPSESVQERVDWTLCDPKADLRDSAGAIVGGYPISAKVKDCFSSNSHKIVILRGCDFFDFPRFCHAQPDCSLKLPQGRHPERSASQIYRLTEGFWRGVEGPRVCHLTDAVRSFSTKRVCMAAENVGVGAGHTKMLASCGVLLSR